MSTLSLHNRLYQVYDLYSTCQDSDPKGKGQKLLQDLSEKFEKKCQEKIAERQNFGPEELQQGLCAHRSLAYECVQLQLLPKLCNEIQRLYPSVYLHS